jgi:hypothetical protein
MLTAMWWHQATIQMQCARLQRFKTQLPADDADDPLADISELLATATLTDSDNIAAWRCGICLREHRMTHIWLRHTQHTWCRKAQQTRSLKNDHQQVQHLLLHRWSCTRSTVDACEAGDVEKTNAPRANGRWMPGLCLPCGPPETRG